MLRKSIIWLAMGTLFLLCYYSGNAGDKQYEYPPCVYLFDDIYWNGGSISVSEFQKIPEEQLSVVGMTEEVEEMPDEHGEAFWGSGVEIFYDSVNDCAYVYNEVEQPDETVLKGYQKFQKTEEKRLRG